MAALMKSLSAGLRYRSANILRAKTINAPSCCFISTSKKSKDVSATADPGYQPPSVKDFDYGHDGDFGNVEKAKNWITYGYNDYDSARDKWAHQTIMFLSISLCLCGITFVWSYLPDYKMKEWARREAYLELARRETEGLLPVDADLVPAARVELPSDEELADFEVVI